MLSVLFNADLFPKECEGTVTTGTKPRNEPEQIKKKRVYKKGETFKMKTKHRVSGNEKTMQIGRVH